MKHHRLVIFTAAFGFAIWAAPAAHAFTFDNQTTTNSDGTAKYVDPDDKISRFGSSDGQTTYQQGNTTLRFGQPDSLQQRYNTDNMFNPVGRPAGER